MIFDVYYYFKSKNGKVCPGIKPNPLEWSDIKKLASEPRVSNLIDQFRSEGNEDCKKMLPSVCYMGVCSSTRSIASMTPTQAIMLDVDHVEEPAVVYTKILADVDRDWWVDNCLLWHITPSGKGLRAVIWAQPEFGNNVIGQIQGLAQKLNLYAYGKVDEPCKDFSRISFLFKADELLYESAQLYTSDTKKPEGLLENVNYGNESPAKGASSDMPEISDEKAAEFEAYEYRGTPVKAIIDRWVEVKGAPDKGEVHNYYNDLVKNFRNITSNNKVALFYLLPRFGHDAEECWSQIKSITRVSTLSSLPKEFYFFLKDNGFYGTKTPQGELANYMMGEGEEDTNVPMPWLPPVFKELVSIAPRDFRASVVNSLLPIMGTLTSYLGAEYYFDARVHTTSFFSIIYAPAGTGKGFVGRFIDLLFEQLQTRDYIQQARDAIFQRALNRKGANDKAPDEPHTSLRIIPAKNSEAEFLQKQRDNKGYHMFTYAAEMDSWAKGVKAAGGNKDDMIRVAWDNDEYGQQFKAANTFKGKVRLYWNVLITGTIQQIHAYFRNVENGLVTRCSFTTIPNQEFAAAPVWKKLNKKAISTIEKFAERCDRMTYEEPCTLTPADIDSVSDSRFDDEIDWQFHFRKRKMVDMEWLRPTIVKFLEDNRKKASLDFDKARDAFRRRVAVRGFRLGIMCYALWENASERELKKCIPFIEWWMQQDLDNCLKLWGGAYNNAVEDTPNLTQRSLYNQLGDTFSKNDLYVLCMKQGIKTPVRQIVCQWSKLGYVNKLDKNNYEKVGRAKA